MVAKIREENANPTEMRKGETLQQYADRLRSNTDRITDERERELIAFSARMQHVTSVLISVCEIYDTTREFEAVLEKIKNMRDQFVEEEDDIVYLKMTGIAQAFVCSADKDLASRGIEHRDRGSQVVMMARDKLFQDIASPPTGWSVQNCIRELEFQTMVVIEISWCYPLVFPEDGDVIWLLKILRTIFQKSGAISRMTRFLNGPICDIYGPIHTSLVQALYDELNQAPPEAFFENLGPELPSSFLPGSPASSIWSYDSGPSSVLQPPSLPPPPSNVQRRLRFGRSNTHGSLQARPQVMVRPKDLPNGANRVLQSLGISSQAQRPGLTQSIRSGSMSGSEVSSKQVRRNLFSSSPKKNRTLFRSNTAPGPISVPTPPLSDGPPAAKALKVKSPPKAAKDPRKEVTPKKTPSKSQTEISKEKRISTPRKAKTPSKSPKKGRHLVKTPQKGDLLLKTPKRDGRDSPRVIRSRSMPGRTEAILAPDTPSRNDRKRKKPENSPCVPETPIKSGVFENGVSPAVRRSFYSQTTDKCGEGGPTRREKVVNKMLAEHLASTSRLTRSTETTTKSPSRVIFSQVITASPSFRSSSRLADRNLTPNKTPVKTPDAKFQRRKLVKALSFTPVKSNNPPDSTISKPFTSFESADSGVVLTPRKTTTITPSKKVQFGGTPKKTLTPTKSILRTRSCNLFGEISHLPAVQKVELGNETLCLSPKKTVQKENCDVIPKGVDLPDVECDTAAVKSDSSLSLVRVCDIAPNANKNNEIDVNLSPNGDNACAGSCLLIAEKSDQVKDCVADQVTTLLKNGDQKNEQDDPGDDITAKPDSLVDTLENLPEEVDEIVGELPKLSRFMSDDTVRSSSIPPVLSPQVATEKTPRMKRTKNQSRNSLLLIEKKHASESSSVRSESPITMKIRRVGSTHSVSLKIDGEEITNQPSICSNDLRSPCVPSASRKYRPLQLNSPIAENAFSLLLKSPLVTPGKRLKSRRSESITPGRTIERLNSISEAKSVGDSDGFSIEEWDTQCELSLNIPGEKGEIFGKQKLKARRSLNNRNPTCDLVIPDNSASEIPSTDKKKSRKAAKKISDVYEETQIRSHSSRSKTSSSRNCQAPFHRNDSRSSRRSISRLEAENEEMFDQLVNNAAEPLFECDNPRKLRRSLAKPIYAYPDSDEYET
ncbi:hypothetical protein QYM36_009486 [Artemia franciscana]|nr:hypothetical protein QYM36_009486 [Artemia franciscana]